MHSRWKYSTLPSVIAFGQGQPRWKTWLTYAESFRLRLPVKRYQLNPRCDMFSLHTGPCRELPAVLLKADVINLHWVSSMIDLASFIKLIPKTTPLVWTLHDMNLLTGGCHYSGDCQKYRTHCESCPELNSRKQRDLAWQNFSSKKRLLDELDTTRLTLVAPSRWLLQCAQQSAIASRFPAHHIPYGLDTETFQPQPIDQARRRYGIDSGQKVILFVADTVENHRKGFDRLIKALQHLFGELDENAADYTLVAIGRSQKLEGILPEGVQLVSPGFVDDDTRMAEIYSLADVFVIPSRQDNLPNTVLEAMACGTPVVGFPVGGIPDMVIDGETGWCASDSSSVALGQAIRRVLSEQSKTGVMAQKCRQLVTSRFSLAKQADSYLELFKKLLNR